MLLTLSRGFRALVASTRLPVVTAVRSYAKKDAKSGKDKDDAGAVPAVSPAAVESFLQQRMDAALDALRKELSNVRAGRPSAGFLDQIMINAGGSKVPLPKVAQVLVRDSNTLAVNVLDKQMLSSVEAAIRESGLGLNPVVDGAVIRVPLPKLTAEHRQQLVKTAAKIVEQAKVSIRSARQDAMTKAKAVEKSSGKDEAKRLEKKLQTITDNYVAKAADLLKQKEKEILS